MVDQTENAKTDVAGHPLAVRFDQFAACLIGLLWPLLLVPSPRVADAILIVATCLLIFATLLDGQARGATISSIAKNGGRRLVRPAPWTFVALAGLLVLAMLSSLWSVAPFFTLERAWQFAGMVVISLLFLCVAPRLAHTAVFRWLALGLVLAVIVIAFDWTMGHPLLKLAGMPAVSIEYNRAFLHYSLLSFPLLIIVRENVWLIAAVFLTVLVSVFLAHNEAAKLGSLCGVAVLAVALLRPQLALRLVVFGFVAAMLVLPMYIGSASVLLTKLPFVPDLPIGAVARIAIWSDIQSRLWNALPLGIGLEATRHTPAMDAIMHQGQVLVEARAPFHPHSMPLQIMYELGVAGSALVLVVGLGTLRWILGQDKYVNAVSLAGFSAMFGTFLVANSTWPTWRIALMALIAGLFLAGRDRLRKDDGC